MRDDNQDITWRSGEEPEISEGQTIGEVRDLGDVIEIPIVEEEVEVIKRPVVKEVIRVRKHRVTEERTVEADVRKEEIITEENPETDTSTEHRGQND